MSGSARGFDFLDAVDVRSTMLDPSESFSVLYREQYRPLVAFFARRVDGLELAQDLAAETFRIAWSRWSDGPFERAWLFGVARHLLVDEYRRSGRERARTDALGRLLVPSRDDRTAVDVRAVMASLPVAQQEVLALAYWEGLSAREIAQALDIAVPAVWTRLHRARRAFAAAWDPPSLPRPADPVSTRSTR